MDNGPCHLVVVILHCLGDALLSEKPLLMILNLVKMILLQFLEVVISRNYYLLAIVRHSKRV